MWPALSASTIRIRGFGEAKELDGKGLGALLLVIGALLALFGAALYFGWLSFLGRLPFGRLPGDIRYESENVRIYVPLASMLLISLLLTVLLNLVRRLF